MWGAVRYGALNGVRPINCSWAPVRQAERCGQIKLPAIRRKNERGGAAPDSGGRWSSRGSHGEDRRPVRFWIWGRRLMLRSVAADSTDGRAPRRIRLGREKSIPVERVAVRNMPWARGGTSRRDQGSPPPGVPFLLRGTFRGVAEESFAKHPTTVRPDHRGLERSAADRRGSQARPGPGGG
jgi:hypothetical protein